MDNGSLGKFKVPRMKKTENFNKNIENEIAAMQRSR